MSLFEVFCLHEDCECCPFFDLNENIFGLCPLTYAEIDIDSAIDTVAYGPKVYAYFQNAISLGENEIAKRLVELSSDLLIISAEEFNGPESDDEYITSRIEEVWDNCHPIMRKIIRAHLDGRNSVVASINDGFYDYCMKNDIFIEELKKYGYKKRILYVGSNSKVAVTGLEISW